MNGLRIFGLVDLGLCFEGSGLRHLWLRLYFEGSGFANPQAPTWG